MNFTKYGVVVTSRPITNQEIFGGGNDSVLLKAGERGIICTIAPPKGEDELDVEAYFPAISSSIWLSHKWLIAEGNAQELAIALETSRDELMEAHARNTTLHFILKQMIQDKEISNLYISMINRPKFPHEQEILDELEKTNPK